MSKADLTALSWDDLLALVLQQAAMIEALRVEVERLTRGGTRQAAPFSKGTRVQSPKRPGRKPGQGPFERRDAPAPESLSEPPIDVPVAEADCPRCGGELAQDRGLSVTQGAITQDALRRAVGTVGTTYQGLCDGVRNAPYVHTDDTGWRVGGFPAWLMVFETDTATVDQIRPRHRNEEVRERIPADYAGVMITDRGKSYDATELAGIKQQKCLSHVLRSLSEVLETKRGRARWFATKLKSLLQRALMLWHERHVRSPADHASRACDLRFEIEDHLRDRILSDRVNQRLLNALGRHADAGSLLRFLFDPVVEPTNNRAERALRPAVIARKVSQCTKTARGTRAFEAWTSVLRTLTRTTPSPALLDAIVNLHRPTAPHPA